MYPEELHRYFLGGHDGMDVNRLLAVLLLFTGAAEAVRGQSRPNYVPPAHSIPTRLTENPKFGIPFQLAANARDATEVQLYVSSDQGVNWELFQRQPPSASGFQFQASEDGEYWFAVRTIGDRADLAGRQAFQPELKVIVDTGRPQLDLQVNIDSTGQASANWLARDLSLAAHTFSLQYQDQTGNWRDVPLRNPSERDTRREWDGTAQWRLGNGAEPMLVRAEVFDRAGNSTVVQKRLSTRPASDSLFQPRDVRIGGLQPPPLASEPKRGLESDTLHTTGSPRWLADVQHSEDAFGAVNFRAPVDRDPIGRDAVVHESKWRGEEPSLQPSRSEIHAPVANRYAQRPESPSSHPLDQRPRITQSPNFELEYELFDVGPQGPRAVELWITRDRGQTWDLHGSDPDRRSPVRVQLKREGLYGFRLAVHGHDLEPTPAPGMNAAADIWVVVDWTKPEGRITRASLGSTPDTLLIEWKAVDALLVEEPITLSYSESNNGPWTPLARNLRNSGAYRWKIDQHLPNRVYLQMEVRDQAGSVTTTVLDSPVFLRIQNPTGRIKGVIRPADQATQQPPFLR